VKFAHLPEILHTTWNKQDIKKKDYQPEKNKPQQEGIPTKPSYKELFILILQKTSNNN